MAKQQKHLLFVVIFIFSVSPNGFGQTRPSDLSKSPDSSEGNTEFSELKRLAESGDADAQYNLGVMYAFGEGVAKDQVEAVKWYRKAAEQGDADAQYNLGVRYAKGEGVLKIL